MPHLPDYVPLFMRGCIACSFLTQGCTAVHQISTLAKVYRSTISGIFPLRSRCTVPQAGRASGWQLGGLLQANTGEPFTPLIGGDPLGLRNTDPFDYPDRLSTPACQSLVNPGNVNNYVKLSCFGLPTATPNIADSLREPHPDDEAGGLERCSRPFPSLVVA